MHPAEQFMQVCHAAWCWNTFLTQLVGRCNYSSSLNFSHIFNFRFAPCPHWIIQLLCNLSELPTWSDIIGYILYQQPIFHLSMISWIKLCWKYLHHQEVQMKWTQSNLSLQKTHSPRESTTQEHCGHSRISHMVGAVGGKCQFFKGKSILPF